MKRFIGVMVVAGVLMALPARAEVIGKTDADVKAIADPLLENVLQGMAKKNYAAYTHDFDATMKETVSEPKFLERAAQIQNWLGNYLYREYLGFLNKDQMTVVFWKGSFDKTADEVLIKLIVSQRDKQYLITGMTFE